MKETEKLIASLFYKLETGNYSPEQKKKLEKSILNLKKIL